jgi:hypothetical protein
MVGNQTWKITAPLQQGAIWTKAIFYQDLGRTLFPKQKKVRKFLVSA